MKSAFVLNTGWNVKKIVEMLPVKTPLSGITAYQPELSQNLLNKLPTTGDGPLTEQQTRWPLVYRVEEVAKILDISRGGAYEAIKNGEIPKIKIGRRLLVPVKAFHDWLDSAGKVSDPGVPNATR